MLLMPCIYIQYINQHTHSVKYNKYWLMSWIKVKGVMDRDGWRCSELKKNNKNLIQLIQCLFSTDDVNILGKSIRIIFEWSHPVVYWIYIFLYYVCIIKECICIIAAENGEVKMWARLTLEWRLCKPSSHLYLSNCLFICTLYLYSIIIRILYSENIPFYCRQAATPPHNL
jgi:hypothetical protein